jgi:hypothetical protein
MPELPPIPEIPGLTQPQQDTPTYPVQPTVTASPGQETAVDMGVTKVPPKVPEDIWGVPQGPPPAGYVSFPVKELDVDAMANLVKGIHEGKYVYFGPKTKDVIDEIYRRIEGDEYDVASEVLFNMGAGLMPSFDMPLHESDAYGQAHQKRMKEIQLKRGSERYIEESPISQEWVFMRASDRAKYFEQVDKGNVHLGKWLEEDIKTYIKRADDNYMQAALDFTIDLANRKIPGIDITTFKVSAPQIMEERAAMQEGENIPGVTPGKQVTPKAKPKAAPAPKKVTPAAPAQKARTPEQEAIHRDNVGQERWGGKGGKELREVPEAWKSIKGAPK